MSLIIQMVRGVALLGLVVLRGAAAQGDASCPEIQPEDGTSCPVEFFSFCDYNSGELCPYEGRSETAICTCFEDGWFCLSDCQTCPSSEPTTGDPCAPNLTTEACGFNQLFCSLAAFGGTTCQCNPSTSSFECTTEETIDSCPSAPCPEELPEDFSFCDAPFGPGIFDGGVSDTCTYGVETCCPSTDECSSPATCGCALPFQFVDCETPSFVCPDLCPESTPLNFEVCDIPLQECKYGGECPYDPSRGLLTCDCDAGEWFCVDDCPTCPPSYSQPASGDPCDPEFTTEECSYDFIGSCSGVDLYATACQCNPDTRVFECTTRDEMFGACPSATCPEETPEPGIIFCDEPFGPGYFDGGSDVCTYGEEFCCTSTGECVPDFLNCGCNLGTLEVNCFVTGTVFCPEICPDAPPESGDPCDHPSSAACYYDFGECGFDPDISTHDCLCLNGAYICSDLCHSAESSSPSASPTEDTEMEGGMMGMSGGMKGGMDGGMKGNMKGSSKSKERSLGFRNTATTHKRHRGVYRGSSW